MGDWVTSSELQILLDSMSSELRTTEGVFTQGPGGSRDLKLNCEPTHNLTRNSQPNSQLNSQLADFNSHDSQLATRRLVTPTK